MYMGRMCDLYDSLLAAMYKAQQKYTPCRA
jgi:hypothetical protein